MSNGKHIQETLLALAFSDTSTSLVVALGTDMVTPLIISTLRLKQILEEFDSVCLHG